jgi:Rieske 2Fe-2S family protein
VNSFYWGRQPCRSLIPVKTKVIGTHIFVCLDANAPDDVSKLEETMVPRFAPYDLRNTKIAFEQEIIENGNWKLVRVPLRSYP